MDTNPAAWSLQAQYGRKGLKYDTAVSSVVAFLRAFVLLGPSNSFSFLAAHAKQSVYIYPPEQETPSPSSSPSATTATTATTTTTSQKRKRNEGINGPMPIILDRLHRLNDHTPAATTVASSKDADDSDSDDDDDEVESLSLASALTRAMGRANVIRSNHAEKNIRILVILASMDYSSYYVPLMNTIFSAEHLNVRMDCLNICQARSKFMEQAVNQTNGVYQHLDGERGRERDGTVFCYGGLLRWSAAANNQLGTRFNLTFFFLFSLFPLFSLFSLLSLLSVFSLFSLFFATTRHVTTFIDSFFSTFGYKQCVGVAKNIGSINKVSPLTATKDL